LIAHAIVAWLVAPPLDLGWRGPAECPDIGQAHASIEQLLAGHEPPEDRRVRADVVLERTAGTFRARVHIDDGTTTGERELEAATCEEVAEAAALIVAMAIDPRLAGDSEPSAPTTEEPPIPVPPAADDDAPSSSGTASPPPLIEAEAPPRASVADDHPRDRTSRARRLRFVGRVAGGVGYGSVPTASGLVMLAVAIAGERWRFEIDADLWTPRRRRSPTNTSVGVRVTGWSVGLRGCGSPLAGRLELPLCAGVRLGALHGIGFGDLDATREVAPWISAMFGAGLWGWITPRFALALDVDGLVAITRPAFDLQPSDFVVRAPAGGIRALFGPVVRLP